MIKAVNRLPHHPTCTDCLTVPIVEDSTTFVLAVFDHRCIASRGNQFRVTLLVVVDVIKAYTNRVRIAIVTTTRKRFGKHYSATFTIS